MSGFFRKIILAYDGSEGSQKALKLTADLLTCHPETTRIYVVNVYEEKIETKRIDLPQNEPVLLNGYLLEGMQLPPASISQELNGGHSTHTVITNSVDHLFLEAKNELESKVPGSVTYQILNGNPGDSICIFAEEIEADLIITGNSGKSGLHKLFIGSVSEKIVKSAPCHVLIAR